MLSPDIHATLAQELHVSERSRQAIPQFSRRFPGMAIEDSYAIQRAWMDIKRKEGRTVIGHKIGLTSRAMQLASQITEPDHGTLLDDMLVRDGAEIEAARFLVPRFETEFAFILGKPLRGPNVTVFDVLDATRWVVPALELIDSRIADWKITFADTVADNGSSAFFVLGAEKKALKGLDLRTCGMALEQNGKVASLGAGVAALGHPLKAAAWLARTLAQRGEPLKAGDIVLTGALGPMVTLVPGDTIRVEIGGLGAVSFTFAE